MRFNDSNSKTFWENPTAIARPFLGDDLDTALNAMNYDRIRAEIFSIPDSDLGSKTAFDTITNAEVERLSDIEVSEKVDAQILSEAGVVHIRLDIKSPLDVEYIKFSTPASRFGNEHIIKVCSDRRDHYFSIVRRFGDRPVETALAESKNDAVELKSLIDYHNRSIQVHRDRFLSMVNGWLQERRSGRSDISQMEKDLKNEVSSIFR